MPRSRLRPHIMSAALLSFAFALHPSSSIKHAAGVLTPGPPMIEPRSGHTATLLPDGKVLIVGGMRRNQDFYKSAELYDPASGLLSGNARVRNVSLQLRARSHELRIRRASGARRKAPQWEVRGGGKPSDDCELQRGRVERSADARLILPECRSYNSVLTDRMKFFTLYLRHE